MKRTIDSKFWRDKWIRSLSPLARYLFIYFITSEDTLPSGVMEPDLSRVAFETSLELSQVKQLLDEELIGEHLEVYGENYDYIWIKNFVHYQAFAPGWMRGVVKAGAKLPSPLKEKWLTSTPQTWAELIKGKSQIKETLAITFVPSVGEKGEKKFIPEKATIPEGKEPTNQEIDYLKALNRDTGYFSEIERSILERLVRKGALLEDFQEGYQRTIKRGRPNNRLVYLEPIILEVIAKRMFEEEQKKGKEEFLNG